MAIKERRPVGALLLLACLSLLWGLNWPAMKVALGEMPVLPFRALCLLVSGPILLGLAALRGGIALRPQEIPALLLAAFFNVTLWHVLTGLGVSLMPAGRASIIAYTMPAWATLLGAAVLGERLTKARLAGLAHLERRHAPARIGDPALQGILHVQKKPLRGSALELIGVELAREAPSVGPLDHEEIQIVDRTGR